MSELPRIEAVSVPAPHMLRVRWRGQRTADDVNLAGWVATGGDVLALLKSPDAFQSAAIGDYGASVTWDNGDGDLAIDAVHLKRLAEEQKPFDSEDVAKWQERVRLSNREVAVLLGVALSTWNSYKAGAKIPKPTEMLLRAIERDPVLLQAHYRPLTAGRPRKQRGAA
jgi:DNA-binding transcriptional regulator YiaG